MAFFETLSWETALDVSGILLCGFIIIYLCFNKIKYRRMLLDTQLPGLETSFKADITHQIVKQQVEKIQYLISGPLANELMLLRESVAAEESIPDYTRPPKINTAADAESYIPGGLQAQSLTGFESDPYGEVAQLSLDGFSPQQIAKKVKLPLGEIELLLKLNRVRV
jgi:hypothetical protein